ncbi:hypothetical protein MHBO_002024 [Bonamia ostreae]|uniref:Uncharacterized protein n=1 Tax=Bonamia ostreae TaxID=126728 RepID=A0ABV2AKZ6_9EUKA
MDNEFIKASNKNSEDLKAKILALQEVGDIPAIFLHLNDFFFNNGSLAALGDLKFASEIKETPDEQPKYQQPVVIPESVFDVKDMMDTLIRELNDLIPKYKHLFELRKEFCRNAKEAAGTTNIGDTTNKLMQSFKELTEKLNRPPNFTIPLLSETSIEASFINHFFVMLNEQTVTYVPKILFLADKVTAKYQKMTFDLTVDMFAHLFKADKPGDPVSKDGIAFLRSVQAVHLRSIHDGEIFEMIGSKMHGTAISSQINEETQEMLEEALQEEKTEFSDLSKHPYPQHPYREKFANLGKIKDIVETVKVYSLRTRSNLESLKKCLLEIHTSVAPSDCSLLSNELSSICPNALQKSFVALFKKFAKAIEKGCLVIDVKFGTKDSLVEELKIYCEELLVPADKVVLY